MVQGAVRVAVLLHWLLPDRIAICSAPKRTATGERGESDVMFTLLLLSPISVYADRPLRFHLIRRPIESM